MEHDQAAQPTILVVEDEALTAMALKVSLQNMGYAVAGPVATGEESVHIARETPLDLVLMDIRLAGEMNGIQAAAHIREDVGVPVIYLTAYTDRETLQGAKVTEPYGYVVKPYQERELHAAIEIALHSSTLARERRRAQEAIERRDKLLRQLVDNSSAIIYMQDTSSRYTLVNEEFEHRLGVSRTDAAGKTGREVLAEPLSAAMAPGDAKVLATGISTRAEEHLTLPDGVRAYAVLRFPLRDLEGTLHGLCAMWTDITDIVQMREALRSSEARYRQLVDVLPDAIALTTMGGTIRYASPATAALVGYAPEELVGREGADFVHPDDIPRLQAEPAADLETHPPVTRVYRLVHKDGHAVWVESRIQAVSDGKTMKEPLALSITRDITERKRAEEELKRLHAELEQRVVERTRDLERINQSLEAFNRSLSHDFVGHVRRIEQLSGVLRQDGESALGESGREILDRIQAEAERLRRLLADLLTATRATQSAIEHAPVDLSRMAQEIVTNLSEKDSDRRVDVRIHRTSPVQGDSLLLRIALENLLGNAWKYTSKTPDARIEFGETELEDGTRAIFVRDNGVGFDPAQAHRLFQPFQRLHPPTEFEGTGLGLSSVKHIIERHGGRVWAEGKPGQGATFSFSLPGP